MSAWRQDHQCHAGLRGAEPGSALHRATGNQPRAGSDGDRNGAGGLKIGINGPPITERVLVPPYSRNA